MGTKMKIVKWHPGRINLTHPVQDLTFDYCPYLRDPLDWGPQHVDLTTQHLMRCAYFGWPLTDYHGLDKCCQALESGEEVTFWCEPVLVSCLIILWALETLVARNANLNKAYLALSPERTDIRILEPEPVRQCINERIPLGDVLDPLLAIRRHLASDSDEVRADRSLLPPPIRDWVSVTDRLEDFLPDQWGLDLLDEILLDRLLEEAENGEDWPCAATILGYADTHLDGHCLITDHLWERLLELSGFSRTLTTRHPDDKNRLVEARFDGEPSYGKTRFRITPRGRRAYSGEIDALPLCSFVRWVGGRQVSRLRPLRRP